MVGKRIVASDDRQPGVFLITPTKQEERKPECKIFRTELQQGPTEVGSIIVKAPLRLKAVCFSF